MSIGSKRNCLIKKPEKKYRDTVWFKWRCVFGGTDNLDGERAEVCG
jgi:hypothetical protein